jgi:hypothetical protein
MGGESELATIASCLQLMTTPDKLPYIESPIAENHTDNTSTKKSSKNNSAF